MSLTLEEEINHCLEIAEANEMMLEYDLACTDDQKEECREWAEEYRQLAEWLKELKELRNNTQHRVHPACSDCKYLKVDANKPCRNCCNNYRSMFERSDSE